MLAVKVLQEQGIEVLGITFVTPFFGPGPGLEAGKKAGIEIRPIDIAQKHLEMMKNPRYGFGSKMNPCIDCHGLMLREAGKVMEEEGADFLFTGEVLGQRPMSQRRDSLRSVEKLAGYQGRILRPLSARLLPPTLVEEEGLVDRTRLLDIQGRSRKRQKELAQNYGIVDYPQPGGGCMLTSEGFANRLRTLFRNNPDPSIQDIEIIKCGRAFSVPGRSICMVGRKQSDNEKIEELTRDRDVFLRPVDVPGPASLILSNLEPMESLQVAAELVASYSDAQEGTFVRVQWKRGGDAGVLVAPARKPEIFKDMLL